MTLPQDVSDLVEEVLKTRKILAKVARFRDEFLQGDFRRLGRTRVSAIAFAEVFDNYYTALETLFVRISQFYGNNLERDRWHSGLLHKMTLSLPDVREAVLSESSASVLHEFLKFRHFRRYYFEFDYDWDKLDFLDRKFEQVAPLVDADLVAFAAFLNRLANPDTPEAT
jgi:hypothetical protein